LIVVDGTEIPLCAGRQMVDGARAWTEHVILENVAPGLLLVFGPITNRPQRVIQSMHGRRNIRWRQAPPVVDEHIEATQSLDVMPPHAGHEDGVTRPELRRQCRIEGDTKARKSFEIRIRKIDEADRLATRGGLEWS